MSDASMKKKSFNADSERNSKLGNYYAVSGTIASLCYRYGIRQTYATMQLIYRCKRENEI